MTCFLQAKEVTAPGKEAFPRRFWRNEQNKKKSGGFLERFPDFLRDTSENSLQKRFTLVK